MSAAVSTSTARSSEATPSTPTAPVLTPSRTMRLHRRCACGGDGGGLSGDCDSCNAAKRTLQRRGGGAALAGLPGSVNQVLAQPGRPLDSGARGFMESRFGQDFSAVRVHEGSAAARSAEDVNALAYTVGQDIVFGAGQYQPHSAEGRHLLAHELAHTVQQQGLQRSGAAALPDQGPEYRALEAEADRAADAVARGAAPGAIGSASRPVLSRTPTPATTATPGAPTATPITVNTAQMGALNFQVTPDGEHGDPGGATAGRQRRFRVDPFYLPGSKGQRAADLYSRRASANQLVATVQIQGSSTQRTATWQRRDPPATLGDTWVRGVRWTAADRDANWQALSGGAAFPQTSVPGAPTCNMDHIVELQLQGGNDADNLQALDAAPNQAAGGTIWNEVSQLGTAIAQQFSVGSGDQVQMTFTRVEQRPPIEPHTSAPGQARSCLMIDIAARAGVETRAVTDDAGAPARSVKLQAGAASNDFVVPQDWGARNRNAPLFDNPANTANAQMVSGLVLRELQFRDSRNARVVARLDERAGRRGTRLPLTLAGERGGDIQINAARGAGAAGAGDVVYRLTLPRNLPTQIAFNYEFMSPGRITRLSVNDQGEIDWRGEITANVPFLPRPLLIIYENNELKLGVELTKNRLRSPFPGFTITESTLTLGLMPLAATGRVDFALGRGTTPVANGYVEAGVDGTGLFATGRIDARIPGINQATGEVQYRGGAWSGGIVIESSQISIPGVTRAQLRLDIDGEGLRPSGEVEFDLPRELGNVTVGLRREGTRFVYSGRGRLRVPGLREVGVTARYDGTTLNLGAEDVGFRWNGFDGRVNVNYTRRGEGRGTITGNGQVNLTRGDVTGRVDVVLHDSGRFSGSGRVTYPFTIRGQRIEATAGVTVQEDQSVRVDGAMRFPQPIQLFRRFGDDKQLFHFQRSIPIPGLSIGPVGVVAVINGGVSANYGIGPGELRNVEITAAFNPLAERIDPTVAFTAQLHIPASAGISGTIGGGIGVEAGVARVNGTLDVTAALNLAGALSARFDARYENRMFSVNARPGIEAALNLGLSLDANARAEAGFGPFTVGVSKTWNLGRRNIVLGQFSVFAPISWSSESGFTAPNMDQLEWGPMPSVDPADLLSQLFRSSDAQEQET